MSSTNSNESKVSHLKNKSNHYMKFNKKTELIYTKLFLVRSWTRKVVTLKNK